MERLAWKLSFIAGLILCFSTTYALHCYQCHDLVKPNSCLNVVTCNTSAGETACFSEEVTDEHMTLKHNMGCSFKEECRNVTFPTDLIGRRGLSPSSVPRDLQLTTCFKCCHGDRCNDRFCDDLCEKNPCLHGATCHSPRLGDAFSCSCAPGYTGNLCQTDVDECTSSPCHNGGSCEDRVNGFVCHCPVRFTGILCETEITQERICSRCEGVQNTSECNSTVICSHGEECYADTYSVGGKQLLRKGCRTAAFCQFFERMVHGGGRTARQSHSHSVTQCSQCCDSDVCNMKLCDSYMSCDAYLSGGLTSSGVYFLDLKDGSPGFQVFCDMDTQGGGWIVFQRRQDGSVDFYRDWHDYKTGFGDLTGEFWLGLDKIHRLNAVGVIKLHVDLGDYSNETAFANYSHFYVGPESDSYRLNISGYSGTAGDSMDYHNGRPFTTKDRHVDNCVDSCKGGWWYAQCYRANLNGPYDRDYGNGIQWDAFRGLSGSLKNVEMKMK